jgi:hypothetical protein
MVVVTVMMMVVMRLVRVPFSLLSLLPRPDDMVENNVQDQPAHNDAADDIESHAAAAKKVVEKCFADIVCGVSPAGSE